MEIALVPTAASDARDELQIRLTRPGLPAPVLLDRFSSHGSYFQEMAPGAWLLPRFPEGTWTLEATIGTRTERKVIEIHAGETIRVDLRKAGQP